MEAAKIRRTAGTGKIFCRAPLKLRAGVVRRAARLCVVRTLRNIAVVKTGLPPAAAGPMPMHSESNFCARISMSTPYDIPDNNTEDVIIDGDNDSPINVGKNNSGRIIIRGSNTATIAVDDGNSGDIQVENDNEGVIRLGDRNSGRIEVGDVNEGRIEVGADNSGAIETENDNEGGIRAGENNSGDIKIGDVNQGKIEVGEGNSGNIIIDDDNEGSIKTGRNNSGRVDIGDVNQGKVDIGDDNQGDLTLQDDNEGSLDIGYGNGGNVEIGDVNDGTITVGDNNSGTISTGDDNEGRINIGDDNEGGINVGDVNEGRISVGNGNRGDINVGDDNEGDITVGENNRGAVNVDEDNDGLIDVGDNNSGTISVGEENDGEINIDDDNHGAIIVDGDNEGEVRVGVCNRGTITVKGDHSGTIVVGPANEGEVVVEGDNDGDIIELSNSDCRDFFDDYDRRFLFTLDADLQQQIRLLTFPEDGVPGYLWRRLTERRRANAAGEATNFEAPTETEKEALENLSSLQLDLFRDHYLIENSDRLNYDSIQWCFLAFANGELRNPATPDDARTRPGEPDGSFFFLFAEFAAAAIECGFDAEIWAELFKTFVKAQEVFVDVYPPVTGLSNNRRSFRGPRVQKRRKMELHNEYENLTPEELNNRYNGNVQRGDAQTPVAFRAPSEEEREALMALLIPIEQYFKFVEARSGGEQQQQNTERRIIRYLNGVRNEIFITIEDIRPQMGFLGLRDSIIDEG